MTGRLVDDIASARGARVGGAYGRNDVVNCLAGCGGVGFVVQKRCVGGVDVAVEAVGRQRSEVVLLRLPFIVGVSIGGEDDKRLTVEVGQGRRWCTEADPSTDSSMKLARCRAVEELARASSRERGGRLPKSAWASRRTAPRWATAGNSVATRPRKL